MTRLREWFEKNRRALPFRDTRDPYAVWVSEILAQQTRMTALLPYYRRFMERFPTVEALAAAEEDEVLAVWAGLGYYSRARNLHKAAKMVCENDGGRLSPDKLLRLPGVGAYTAGAIASIVFGEKTPAVDGNVRRVYARVEAAETGDAAAWVRGLMDIMPPGTVTEALMELGALVCLPQTPRCHDCPIRSVCKAEQTGQTHLFPPKKKKPPKREETRKVCLVKNNGGAFLIRQRNEALLHNMWEFPDENTLLRDQIPFVPMEMLDTYTHVFTHRIWIMEGWLCVSSAPILPEAYRWMKPCDFSSLAFPSAMRKFCKLCHHL